MAMAQALEGVATGATEAETATVKFEDQLRLVGSYQSQIESFSKRFKSLEEERAALIAEKTGLIKRGYGEQSTAVKDITAKLEENQTKINDVKKEHELATKSILLGYLQQQLGIDGLDARETEFLLEKGQEWGVYSDTAVEEMKRALRQAELLTAGLNGIPRSLNIGITVNTKSGTIYNEGNDVTASVAYQGANDVELVYGGMQAAGGDYMVTRPTMFIAGESGPERATFTPGRFAGAQGGGDVHIHIGTLVADDRGLAKLEEKLRGIRRVEDQRRGL
jgi:hypothetical protein